MRGLITNEGFSPEAPKSTADVLRDRIIRYAQNAPDIQILQLNVIIDKLANHELLPENIMEQSVNITEPKLLGSAEKAVE